MREDQLVLVDYDDREIGSCGKLETHKKQLLHRAFSVFIFNGDEVIIQKRAAGKYHSAGLWANTCCSHPRCGEEIGDAVRRRLKEEAGIECGVTEAGAFIYYARFDNGLCEYEYDHVFIGEYDGAYCANPEEAEEMISISIEDLKSDIEDHPEKYAAWFFTALNIALRAKEGCL